MDILVAWFDQFRDVVPKMEATTWTNFASKLETLAQYSRHPFEKETSPLVSAAVYDAGGRRGSQDVVGFGGWFAIDIDYAPCSLQDASDLCREANISHVIWTTTNHSAESPRFRVAFPLDRYVVRDEMARFWLGVHLWFNGWGDTQTKDPSRMMVAPAYWLGTNPQFIRADGLGAMSVDEVLELAPASPVPAKPVILNRRVSVNPIVAGSPERAKAELAIQKWKLGTLIKSDLQGVKAQHLVPDNSKSEKHGRGRDKLDAAKKTLGRMQRAAK